MFSRLSVRLAAAAKQYLDPSKLQVVAVGDASKVAEILPSTALS